VLVNVGPFKKGEDGLNWIEMDMEVRDPNGNIIFSEKGMLGENGHVNLPNNMATSPYGTFYTTTDLAPGKYKMTLTIYDKVGGGKASQSATFTLE